MEQVGDDDISSWKPLGGDIPSFPMDYQSKSDIIAAYVREMIITGQAEPNSPLRQRDLAKRFGVSPTPVREALHRLEAEGLVKYDLHRGATVIDSSFAP